MQENDSSATPEISSSARSWRVESYVVWRGSRLSPPTDVIELPEKLLIVIEIAGMRAADFSLVLLQQRLIITGRRERPALQNAAYHQVEIGYGEFRVEIALPWQVEREHVSATYRDGFLQIELPRRSQVQIHVIDGGLDDTQQQEKQP